MIHFEDADEVKPLVFHEKSVDLRGSIPKSKLGDSYKIPYPNDIASYFSIKILHFKYR